jgi:hypothetical protein
VRFVFAGGNNITLSQSLNGASGTITISAFNASVQPEGTQTIGMSNIGNTSGTTGVATGTGVQFVFAGGNNITLSQSLNASSGTITISAGNGVETIGMSNLGNTSGTTGVATGSAVQFVFAGGNNITLSQSLNGSSGTITISGGAGGAFTGGVSTQGNTLGTTGTVNNGIVFVGGNNITLSQSSAAGGATITISAPSGGGLGVSTGGNTSGTTGTVDFQMVFVGGNNITLSQSTNGSSATITVSAPNQTVESQSFGMSNLGNTAGTTGIASGGQVRFVLQGSNNITLSQSINGASGTISIIGGAGGGGVALGMTNTGNTSGTTFSSSSGTMYFQGTNNVTVSNSSAAGAQTLWISGPTGGGAGMGSTGNTFGTSGTVGAELYFYGSGGVSLSQSTNAGSASLTILGQPTQSMFYWQPAGSSSVAMVNGSASFQMIQIPYPISFTRIDIPLLISLASSATTNTGDVLISSGLVIYSFSGAGTLNPITGSFGTTTHTWASNTANFNNLTGPRVASFAINSTLGEGRYYIGFQMSTTNNSSIGLSTTQYANTISLFVGSVLTASNFADFGSATNASYDLVPGMGIANSTITATNATIGIANISATGASKLGANFGVLFRKQV